MSSKIHSSIDIEKVIQTAEDLQKVRRNAPANPFSKRLGAIISSPEGKVFLIKMLDVAFRSKNYARIATYMQQLLKSSNSYQKLFSSQERVLVRLFKLIGYKLPSVSVPIMLRQIQEITSSVVFFLGEQQYKNHYNKRKKENIQLNVNLIGEALIGEGEAKKRIASYCELLHHEEVEYISVKASTLFSQISAIAHDAVVDTLVERLSILYKEVIKIEKETGKQKFINLDMEEYRDLSITLAAFKKTLALDEFTSLCAGLVIQAYLPDAYYEVRELQEWALERVKNGGSPIKVRVVKGANLEMERTEASLKNWPLATYASKVETDANYKKILCLLLDKDKAHALHIGVASHNIFEIAFAITYIEQQAIKNEYVCFEMLEGVAQATVNEIVERGYHVSLYTPVVKRENYTNAIAYLVRRLDEGTQERNFLKEGYELEIGSEKWNLLKADFLTSVDMMNEVQSRPNRVQNRSRQQLQIQEEFKNTADTDWSVPANRSWIGYIRQRWEQPSKILGDSIPVIGGARKKEREKIIQKNWKDTLPWQYEQADKEDYLHMIDCKDSIWYSLAIEEKVEMLRMAAYLMGQRRGDLVAVAIEELGKTIQEADMEVSEAIDFANFYAQNMIDLEKEGVSYEKKGIHLVLSPWNFPLAIPIGGVLASLAAGKRVILKPAPQAMASAYLIGKCLWDAGIPEDAFAFLPCNESTLDDFLTIENIFDAVILTGATETAQHLLSRNPNLKLYAETGGKNATYISPSSDKEQAIAHVLQSAFGNTGQKCSATSLLILEKELFEDKHFKDLLKDAVESKICGNPWELNTEIGPLAVPMNDKLKYVFEHTDESQWLVKPKIEGEYMLSPCVKWGVTIQDYEYETELFGPVLLVMEAEGLHDAIEKINILKFGLTSGIESLDNEEVNYWKKHVNAGNLYVNRTTTGAIVERQPFGGIKASSFGFGMKAGGNNYIRQFLSLPKEHTMTVQQVEENYRQHYLSHFSKEIDYAKVRGQHNICRYIKPKKIKVLVGFDTLDEHIKMVSIACAVLKVKVHFFSIEKIEWKHKDKLIVLNDWLELEKSMNQDNRFRSLTETVSDSFKAKLHEYYLHLYDKTPTTNGRFELLNYLNEQSVSINYHRYGNLMGEGHD